MSERPDFENAVRRIRNTALPFTAAVNVCKGIFEQGEIAGAGDRAALLAVVEAARETLGRYEWHKTSCGLWFVAPPPAGRERPWRAGDEVNCSCGLAAALSACGKGVDG